MKAIVKRRLRQELMSHILIFKSVINITAYKDILIPGIYPSDYPLTHKPRLGSFGPLMRQTLSFPDLFAVQQLCQELIQVRRRAIVRDAVVAIGEDPIAISLVCGMFGEVR